MRMVRRGFTESDWKLFRKKVVGWQENYMAKLCAEYVSLLQSNEDASEKFWALEKRIKRDKKRPGVMLEMSRSQMLDNIVMLLRDGVIEERDLADFSEGLRTYVASVNIRL